MEKIREILIGQGILRVGFCTFEGIKNNLIQCRAKARLPKDAKTVICCVFPYKVKEEKPQNISRYAAVCDYHTLCGVMLQNAADALRKSYPQFAFETFTDNSPLPEVLAFSHTGLGKVGKNGLFIDDEFGSFVFLGEIVTDLDLNAADHSPIPCLNCGRCQLSCPVSLNKEKCLSKVSQQKGDLNLQQAELLRKNKSVWGCDICSEVCPENRDKKTTYIKEFINSYRNCFSPDENYENRAYTWRGEKVILRNYAILEEN